MKSRARERPEAGRSATDTSASPSHTATRCAARQVCIGDMEQALHNAFAIMRVPGGTDFVYERDHDAFGRLDEFCNWNQMSEPAAPLVVSGPPGSGKSALLANWLLHYQRRLEQRPKHGGPLEEPFIFCHAVGCTRHGVDVNQLLWRLLADVKQRFDLARNVPDEAERLSWELPRFLDLAARKGRVIIVIDGLHRLQDKNGGETGLQWLPLQVPGNVRIIVTATHPDPNYLQLHEQKIRQHMVNPHEALPVSPPPGISSGERGAPSSNSGGSGSVGRGQKSTETAEEGEAEYESSHRRRKVLMELCRRKWPTLELGPLQTWRKRDILEEFLRQSLTGRSSREQATTTANRGGSGLSTQQHGSAATFLTGVEMMADGTLGLATDTVASGVSVDGCGGNRNRAAPLGLVLFPSMIESILSSDATSSALYLRTLLRALEWAATNAYDVRALLKIMLSTTTIGELYSVFFKSIESGSNPTEASIRRAQEENDAEGGVQALQDTIDGLRGIGRDDSDASAAAAEGHRDGHRHLRQPVQFLSPLSRPDVGTDAVVGVHTATSATNLEGNMSLTDERRASGRRDCDKNLETADEEEEASERDNNAVERENDARNEDGEDEGYSEEEYEDSDFEDNGEGEQETTVAEGNRLPPGGDATAAATSGDSLDTSDVKSKARGMGNVSAQCDSGGDQSGGGGRRFEDGASTSSREAVDSEPARSGSARNRAADTSVGGKDSATGGMAFEDYTVFEVPVYLSGGKKVDGFGVTVGRAMALLHVVRHGLRSQELWSLLAALDAHTSAQEKAEGTEGEAESRLLRKLLKNQNRLIDSIRLMDVDRDGVISTAEFRAAIIAMNVGLTDRQVENLIRSIDVDNDGELDMQEMIERFSTTARKMKHGGGGGRRKHSQTNGRGEFESSTGVWSDETEEDTGDCSSLSDEARTSLKSALSVLGVSHDGLVHNGDEHSIFVLGLDAEDLREVVFRRYVASASTWHSRLVRFFQAQPPSPRRCEELPWHLNKCYRWHPLKNSLVDLRTFETMWTTTQLKRELMDYWKLLTEGPLHASEEAAAADLRNDSKSRLVSLMMQESCNQGGGGSAVSAADIIAVGSNSNATASGKVAPFDLVFEYNHAVEGWQAFSRPTISRLGEMVHTIGDFMREMSQLVQKEFASPPFLHMPLDFKDLQRVGINPDLIALTGAGATPTEANEHSNSKEASLSKPKGAPKDKLSYYRVAPYYYFQRWLWVQFPWMSLSASGVSLLSEAAAAATAEGLPTGCGLSPGIGSSPLGRGDAKGDAPGKSRRFWSVKRIDPFGEPAVNVSEDRMRSRLKAELGKSATTTLLDTQSHSSLLHDVGAGMVSNAASRRHALRVKAEETFGKPARSKQPRALLSMKSAPSSITKGAGGRGGFLSEEESDLNLPFTTSSADLKSLGIGRDVLASIVGGGDLMGHGSGMGMDGESSGGSKGSDSLGGGRGRRRNRGRGDPKFRAGLVDARKTVSTLAGTNPLSPLPGKALVETGSFLGTSISIFPMSVDEEMVLEAKDMALKLRHVHDALQGEVKRKNRRLIDIRRGVEERNSQDAYTMSRTMAGEHMIKALDTRLAKVRCTSAELERVGEFYGRIIELCIRNPPKDNRHLRALEEQVFLSKQQTTDLAVKVQDLLFQKDAIERLGIDGLRAQLARTKAVRQKVNARTEQLREQIEKSVKSERRGLKAREVAFADESSPPRGMASADHHHTSMHGVGVTALVAANRLASGAKRAHSQLRLIDVEEPEEEGVEEALEQLAMLVGAEHVDDITEKFKDVGARAQDLQHQKQTSTAEIEGLRKELNESRRILSDLQVVDGDGDTEGGARAGGTATNPPCTSGKPNLHREERRLDDLVFQSGIRLAQSTRRALKAKGEFTDLKVGILHLADLIDSVVRQANDDDGFLVPTKSRVQQLHLKSLSVAADQASTVAGATTPAVVDVSAGSAAGETGTAAASNTMNNTSGPTLEDGESANMAPVQKIENHMENAQDPDRPDGLGLVETIPVDTEEDVCKLLGACETRVCRIIEACGLGEGGVPRDSAADSPEDTTVQRRSFWHSGLNTAAVQPGSEPATEGPETASAIQRLFMGRTKGLKGDGVGMDIRVLPPDARDNRFERSMGDSLRQQNEKQEMQETEANNLDRNAVATGVASFLEDALNSKSANKHLRRANMLVMGKQGKRAGFGLVMDDVLSGADIDIYGLADATRRRANGMGKALHADGAILSRMDLSTAVRARPDLKASSQATSSRRKHEDRKKALMKKRVAARA